MAHNTEENEIETLPVPEVVVEMTGDCIDELEGIVDRAINDTKRGALPENPDVSLVRDTVRVAMLLLRTLKQHLADYQQTRTAASAGALAEFPYKEWISMCEEIKEGLGYE